MTFTNPGALLWAAIAVPIIVFCLFRIRTRTVEVSTMMFWQHALTDRRSSPSFLQLKNLLFLMLQLLMVMLLVFWLAEPFSSTPDAGSRRVVLIIDNSFSMQAADTDTNSTGTRFEKAKQQAELLIGRLRAEDQLAILSAVGTPHVESSLMSDQARLMSDQARLIQTLNQLELASGPVRIREAIDLASSMLNIPPPNADNAVLDSSTFGDNTNQIIVLTDGCFTADHESATDRRIRWTVFGTPVDNLAISQFEVSRSLLDPIGYEVFAEVSNFGSEGIFCQLHLELNDQVVDVIPLRLRPGESSPQLMEVNSAVGGVLQLTLTDIVRQQDIVSGQMPLKSARVINALTSDDKVSAVLPPHRNIPVTLATSGNLFLQRVLEAFPFVDLTILNLTDGDGIPTRAPEQGILMLHEVALETIPSGNVVVISPTSASDLWHFDETILQPVILSSDDQHLLLRDVSLNDVRISQAQRLRPKAAHRTLVSSSENDPLLILFPRAVGDVLVLPISLDQGDLPLRAAFPVLFANTLSWFGREWRQSLEQPVLIGHSDSDLRQAAVLPSGQPELTQSMTAHSLRGLILTTALLLTTLEWILYHRRWI